MAATKSKGDKPGGKVLTNNGKKVSQESAVANKPISNLSKKDPFGDVLSVKATAGEFNSVMANTDGHITQHNKGIAS